MIDYPRRFDNNLFYKIQKIDDNIDITMFFERLNEYEVIKKLTYLMGNIKTETNIKSKHKEDYEYINTTYTDLEEIRHDLQINNEKMYNYYFIITLYDLNLDILNAKVNNIKNLLYSMGIIAIIPTYRLIDLYKSIMPFNSLEKAIKYDCRRSMVTKTISNFYPFNSDKIFDKNGVLIGCDVINKTIKILDRFDREKYINGNLCVFGTSGSGKSYFIKTQLIRNYIIGNTQIIIDPEGEYINIGEYINALIIKNSEIYKINIFDIDINNEKCLLELKIQELLVFFEMIIPNITLEEKVYLEKIIISEYNKKGINFDNKSLYNYEKNGKILINPIKKSGKEIPIIEDLYKQMIKDNKYINLQYYFKRIITGSLKWFNGYTNVDFNNKTVIFDVSNIRNEYIDLYMFLFLNKIKAIIKRNIKEKKIIYIDELWNLIGCCSNNITPNFVVETFKTIRKYNGVATSITQDIYDLIVNKNVYGKTIINNSIFFCIFKQDIENIEYISKIINLNESEKELIKKLNKGECLFKIYGNSMFLKITSSELEKQIINMEDKC